MRLTFHTLDVFTGKPFTGNGLAVVIGADGLTDSLMQNIAAEFNLSETIFVQAPDNPANTAKVRIFMPKGELPFAGHPTIGCAILLASLKHKPGLNFETEIKLEEKAGLVPVKVTRAGNVARGQFTAPRVAIVEKADVEDKDIAAAIGLERQEIGFESHRPGILAAASRFFCIPVASLDALRRAQVNEPHFSRVLKRRDTFSAYMYTRSGAGFRVRLYAPADGIPEDPAAGSAAAAFASQVHVAERLGDGTHGWRLEQGLEMGRPSELAVEADVRGSLITAVRVAGEAVQVMQGTIDV
jgi:trans-2,3-dihydro-3-hydroxyanthranilate isomerase